MADDGMIESSNPDYGPVSPEELLFDVYLLARERREWARARLAKVHEFCAMNGIDDVPFYIAFLKRDLAWAEEDIEIYERDFPLPKPWVPKPE